MRYHVKIEVFAMTRAEACKVASDTADALVLGLGGLNLHGPDANVSATIQRVDSEPTHSKGPSK